MQSRYGEWVPSNRGAALPGRAGADLPPSFGCPGSPSEWGWQCGFLGCVGVMGDESPDTLAQVSPGGPQSSEVPDAQWAAFVVWSFAWHCGRAEGGRGAQIASSLPSLGCTFFTLSLHPPAPPALPSAQFSFFLSFPSLSSPLALVFRSLAFCLFLWFSLRLALPSLPELHTHGPCLYLGWAPRHRRKSCDPKSSDLLTTKAWPLQGEPSLSGRRWERGMGPSLREAFRGKICVNDPAGGS